MRKLLFSFFFFCSVSVIAQDDTTLVRPVEAYESPATKIFYSQKAINSKTVEVHRKGVMEFNVSHNFGDIAGDGGGITRFFGLDQATDIKIGFQTGLSDRLNLITARTRGAGLVQQMWELGLKWQILKQSEDKRHPISMTFFVNDVVSSQKKSVVPNIESSFDDFGSRHSQFMQLMLARKFGSVSIQVSPAYLHTNYVEANDDESIFALGAAFRLPISRKIVLLADWFHPFRSESSEAYYKTQGMEFHDPIGVGLEILTEGHVFHLNFTNATELLENRFLRRTVTSWGDGQYRWSFTISRNFVLFRDKE